MNVVTNVDRTEIKTILVGDGDRKVRIEIKNGAVEQIRIIKSPREYFLLSLGALMSFGDIIPIALANIKYETGIAKSEHEPSDTFKIDTDTEGHVWLQAGCMSVHLGDMEDMCPHCFKTARMIENALGMRDMLAEWYWEARFLVANTDKHEAFRDRVTAMLDQVGWPDRPKEGLVSKEGDELSPPLYPTTTASP
jgi:hypothetical protein